MGLAERRASATYQAGKFEDWKKKISQSAGIDLAFDVKWEEISKDGYQEQYDTLFDFCYFSPLEIAMQKICVDTMGKDALKAKIKKVLVTSQRSWCSLEATVEGDTLHLDADPTFERSESVIQDHAGRIVSVLESNL